MTKETIVDTAISLFQERGYNNVTVMDICNACSITKPTFYNYVSGKESLIIKIYDNIISKLLKNTYQLFSLESSYQQLLSIFSILIEETQKYGADLFSQLFIANLNENRYSFALRDSLTQLCLSIIQKGQANGEFLNPYDATLLYQTIAHLFTGYETVWCINKGESHFKKDFFASLELVLLVEEKQKNLYLQFL
ncbi:MAG TPA: TetR/AcrR family transcriptional regulator [Lachnospiraceae bacterium]